MESMRTCIGCGRAARKDSLMRLAKSPSGDVAFDPSGKGPGRGAYVCSIECFERSSANGRLSSSLRTRVDSMGAASLLEDLLIAVGRE